MTKPSEPMGPVEPVDSKQPIEPLIPFDQAAKILNMSERTLKRRVRDREIAVIRDGTIVSIAPADMRAYIAQRRVEPKEAPSENPYKSGVSSLGRTYPSDRGWT